MMFPSYPDMMFHSRLDFFTEDKKNKKERKPKEPKKKKYKPRQLTKQEKLALQQREKRFRASIGSRENDNIMEDRRDLDEQMLDEMFKSQPHSEKIQIARDGEHQFAYKVVYKNGDGYKAQRGMAIQLKYRTYLFDGTNIHNQFYDNQFLEFVGRGKMHGIYQTIGMNVTKGEMGTIVATGKYAYGERGYFPSIPPYATMRTDYWVIDLRQKQFWEVNEVEKCEEIQALLDEIDWDIGRLRSEPDMDPEEKRQMILFHLYNMRIAEDRLVYSYAPRADNCRKKVCANEIYLVYHLGQKILALELMDKYFELQGRNTEKTYLMPRQEKLEYQLYRIKIEVEMELGIYDEAKKTIDEIQNVLSKGYLERFNERVAEWKQIIQQYESLPPQEKNQKDIQFSKKKQQLHDEQEKNAPQQTFVYSERGYRPEAPQNRAKNVELTSTVPYDEIIEWIVGKENFPIHEQRLKDGWFHKKDWDRANKYEEDFQRFLMQEEQRREQCKQKGEPFEEGFWVHKLDEESWEQYDARRREQQLFHYYFKVHRQYGEKYKDFVKRRRKIEKQQADEKKNGLTKISALQKRLEKKMKKGFKDGKLPQMPRQKAYDCFGIE